MNKSNKKIIFIMGVSGAGKSTIGTLLSEVLNIPFYDGDYFHPKENISKMKQGEALNDEDRYGWLQSLNNLAKKELKKRGCIIACSALKKSYRDILIENLDYNSNWVFLQGSYELIKERLIKRKGHFMSSDLLRSQFDILDEPKDAIIVPQGLTPNETVEFVQNEILKQN